MSRFYFKNKKGEYLPIELNSIMSKDINDRLVIVRVGSDDHPATMSDLDETEESFAQADVLNEQENVSIIITPYQIDVNLLSKEEQLDKAICLQVTSGDDIKMLDTKIQNMYKKLKNKFKELVILPTPLKLADYNRFVDTLKRCDIRRKRRTRIY